MGGNPGCLAISAALAIASCAPPIDGPIDHQRAIDRDDGDRLGAQLAQLPGAVAATVVLHHAMRDPLAITAPTGAAVAAVITVDDKADRDAVRAAASRLAHAMLPDAPLVIEINASVHRATLAKVGPFSVEDSSRAALRATLALGCLVTAGLATAIWLRERRHRRGNSAQ